MARSRNGFVRFLGGTLKGFDILTRVIVDVVVIGIVVIVLIFIFTPKGPTIPKTAALALDPQGTLVEQVPDPVKRAMGKLVGRPVQPVTRVRDLVRALDMAAQDSHIKAVTLDLDDFSGGSFAQLQRVGNAIKRFKKSGKPVIAWASNYTQGSYYLAASASKAYLTSSQGMVSVLGLSAYRNYYKDLIDKLKIEWHVFRVGKYKSFVEPYTRNDMSKAAKEENTELIDTLWNRYVGAVASARGNAPDEIMGLANNLPAALSAMQGSAAQVAVQKNLIDGVVSLPALNEKIGKLVGVNSNTGRYDRISLENYLAVRKPAARIANRDWDQVAIIVAQGDIGPGKAPPGSIGADTLSALLHRAARDDRVKAVVLDVDSPGGSAIASDQILHAELALEKTGKPLVVSMAGVAASGGYWISMAGDRIYASPVTITGSIGIFGMFPTFERTAAWIGVHNDGVETSPLADFGDPLRPLTPAEGKVFQLIVKHGYAEFTGNVSHYRNLPLSHVQAIAQGRVWTGEDAKRIGLIDDFGDLATAVKSAASMAKLQKYGVTYIAPELSSSQQLIVNLANDSSARSVATHFFGGSEDSLLSAARPLLRGLKATMALHDPRGVYAYCFCGALTELH
ncbi:MAG: signal peptide peptidase SppA [Gammaproteobacteria bacterium]